MSDHGDDEVPLDPNEQLAALQREIDRQLAELMLGPEDEAEDADAAPEPAVDESDPTEEQLAELEREIDRQLAALQVEPDTGVEPTEPEEPSASEPEPEVEPPADDVTPDDTLSTDALPSEEASSTADAERLAELEREIDRQLARLTLDAEREPQPAPETEPERETVPEPEVEPVLAPPTDAEPGAEAVDEAADGDVADADADIDPELEVLAMAGYELVDDGVPGEADPTDVDHDDALVEAEPEADEAEPEAEEAEPELDLDALVSAPAPARRPRWVIVGVGLVVALVAVLFVNTISGDDSSKREIPALPGVPDNGSTKPATPGPGTSPAAVRKTTLAYLEAFATQRADQMDRMVELAAPGSPAQAYAVHQQTLARIDPKPNEPRKLTRKGDAVELCADTAAGRECDTYAAFSTNEQGLLADFTVDGVAMHDRIALGNGTVVTAGPMSVKIRSAYAAASNLLFVVIEVQNVGDSELAPATVAYAPPGGGRVDPTMDTFVDPLQPGESVVASIAFPGVGRGGQLVLVGHPTGSATLSEAQITVP